ncbi:MAG TPA: hypothetical protein VHM00_00430 [Caldimonas sp.]|jgi:hypothetical protein|nr:hypothetical protein [Caldimonas sp.]HEX2539530.1 hypothetical protein [Caldimonas sp.]
MPASGKPATSPDDGPVDARAGEPEITSTPGSTDASRGRPEDMARHRGEPVQANDPGRQTGNEPATSSQGSRTGSLLGSQSDRTGMGDGPPSGKSQGLAGGQDNGAGPDSSQRP